MKILTFGIDNRALLDADGHSKRWNSRMGAYVDRLDVLVEVKDKRISEKWIADNVRIIPLYVPHPALYSFIAYKRALHEHKNNNYDLATTEEPFRTGLAGWLFKRKTGVPLSVEYHNDTFYNHEWLNERPIIHRAYIPIGKKVIRAADSIRCVNKKNFSELKKICNGNPGKLIDIIPVPTEFYNAEKYADKAVEIRNQITKNKGDIIILYVGRLAPVKKVNELIEIFIDIRKNYKNIHSVIIGDGPEYSSLVRLAEKHGSDRIIFTGHVAEDDVFSYYGASDIFVNPAHIEPYGRVYIEAMSAGKPVITTSRTGAVEDNLCIKNENSLIVEPGNKSELKIALIRLIENEELRKTLGENGSHRVKHKFNYDESLKNMRNFWDKTIKVGNKENAYRQ